MMRELSEAGHIKDQSDIELRNNITKESKSLKEKRERAKYLQSIIMEIEREYVDGALIVVEGKKDELALQSFGLKASCLWLSREGFSNFLHMAESSRKVILLLDYDRKGRYMYAKATRILQSKSIPTDGYYRRIIRKVTNGEIFHIEEISLYSSFIDSE